MKSKRRHELQTNDLATMLERWWKEFAPYRTPVLVALVVLVGGGLVYRITQTIRRQSEGEVWRSFFAAASSNDPVGLSKQLKRVARQHQDSTAGLWAALLAGDVQFNQGFRQLFSDRALATTSLNDAKDQYEFVLKHVGNRDRTLKLRALYGLAQTHEALSHVKEAVKYYQQVVELAGDDVIGADAKKRLELLQDNKIERWYFWFARQEPRPPAPAQPKKELPGTLPGLDDLPDEPDLKPSAPSSSTESSSGNTSATKPPASSGSASPKSPSTPASTTDTKSSTPSSNEPKPSAPSKNEANRKKAKHANEADPAGQTKGATKKSAP